MSFRQICDAFDAMPQAYFVVGSIFALLMIMIADIELRRRNRL